MFTPELIAEIEKFGIAIEKLGFCLHEFDDMLTVIPKPDDKGNGYLTSLMLQIDCKE